MASLTVTMMTLVDLIAMYRVGQKSDTLFNYTSTFTFASTMPHKLQNTRYLYYLNNLNICY